jgi:hypothetical protein
LRPFAGMAAALVRGMNASTALALRLAGIRNGQSGRPVLVALALGYLACSGCYSTWDVGPNQISRLQSYRSPEQIELVSKEGETFTFDRDTTLIVPGGRPDGYRFESIESADGTIRGETVEGLRISVASSDVKAERFSVSKTVALSVGVPVGVTAIGALIVWGMAVSMHNIVGSSGSFSLGGFGGGCGKTIHAPRRL